MCWKRKATVSVVLVLLAVCSWTGATAAQPSAQEIEFFEKKIRPLLIDHCYQCHSAEAKEPKAGLHLDSRAGLLKGGESGAAVLPGEADESLLIEAVRYRSFEMPPDRKLPDAQIADLVRWVEMGAPWPKEPAAATPPADVVYDWQQLRRQHWAWQPIRKPQIPVVRDATWPRDGIDHFVLARLEASGLKPARPADKRTLIRRAYFDLIGLPPTPDAVDAFLNDTRPTAFASVVDRLLASPHYGERWARHWLDVARYSDGYGGFLDNKPLPNAYRYRDWVVAALNRDLPYDQFVKQQIAGDLMGQADSRLAPGFFAVGPTYKSDGGDPDSIAQAKSETLDDRIDTLSRGFLGLTVACARCHDHKFDPIPTEDYYALAGVFNNTTVVDRPLVPAEVVDRYNQAQQAIKELEKNIKQREAEVKKAPGPTEPAVQEELVRLRAELEQRKREAPPMYPVAHTLDDSGNQDMPVALRGNLRKPGRVVPRRFLRILAGKDAAPFRQGSGRLELADAVAGADNPLTSRVIVNRIWLHHFGKAIVRTPSNFGRLGQPPTHPGLLDYLADRLIASGWSIKSMHRAIMLSASYQMSSEFDARSFQIDGDNRMIWRMNPRRLDVEAWRDGLLAVSDELDQRIGGQPTQQLSSSHRRTLYSVISRNRDRFESDEFLRLFDFPAPRVTSAKRTVSTVPQQFLFMLNGQFMVERAKALAARLLREADRDSERIRLGYALLYGRAPTAAETRLGLEYLTASQSPHATAQSSSLSLWEQYAQVLLSANEFMYVQ